MFWILWIEYHAWIGSLITRWYSELYSLGEYGISEFNQFRTFDLLTSVSTSYFYPSIFHNLLDLFTVELVYCLHALKFFRIAKGDNNKLENLDCYFDYII